MRILFCTDGSKISFDALRNISKWVNDAIIDVICVIDWSFLSDEVSIEADGFAMSCANIADTILEYAEKEVEFLNLKLGKKIKNCGSAVESILEQSEKEKYDLILMGSHGKKGIQKWLGSVSQEVLNSSKITDYISREANNRKRILFTTDGSKCSIGIIQKLLPMLNLENKEIYVCMVVEDPNLLFLEGTLDTNWLLEIEKQQELYAAHAVKDIQTVLEDSNITANETVILRGIPAQKIIDYSKTNEIDLIILGAHNKSRLDKFLTESVSKRVLSNVKSDVMLVKCDD